MPRKSSKCKDYVRCGGGKQILSLSAKRKSKCFPDHSFYFCSPCAAKPIHGTAKRFFLGRGHVFPHWVQGGIIQPRKNLFAGPVSPPRQGYVWPFSLVLSEPFLVHLNGLDYRQGVVTHRARVRVRGYAEEGRSPPCESKVSIKM